MKTFWQGLSRAARVSLVVGVAVIVAATAALGAWLLRTERDVLFTSLSAQDAAAMTAELERMKLPYALGEDGTTILVDKATLGRRVDGLVTRALIHHHDLARQHVAIQDRFDHETPVRVPKEVVVEQMQVLRVRIAAP